MTGSRPRRLLQGLALSVATSLLLLLLLELVARGWAARRRAAAREGTEASVLIGRHPELGWTALPGREAEVEEGGGRFTTDERGWRGDGVGAESALIAVGDSFTHAAGVADGDTWFEVLAAELEVPVVGLGVNGYGTVQQWMLARRELQALPRPVAVVVQMTDNDPVNNSLELERRSWRNNNLLRRPYIGLDGATMMGDPRRLHERTDTDYPFRCSTRSE